MFGRERPRSMCYSHTISWIASHCSLTTHLSRHDWWPMIGSAHVEQIILRVTSVWLFPYLSLWKVLSSFILCTLQPFIHVGSCCEVHLSRNSAWLQGFASTAKLCKVPNVWRSCLFSFVNCTKLPAMSWCMRRDRNNPSRKALVPRHWPFTYAPAWFCKAMWGITDPKNLKG